MDPAFDYSHRFHAGNVGDVLKHLVLVAVLDELLSAERPVRVIETHAGEGRYLLGSTGEWMEGCTSSSRSPRTDSPRRSPAT